MTIIPWWSTRSTRSIRSMISTLPTNQSLLIMMYVHRNLTIKPKERRVKHFVKRNTRVDLAPGHSNRVT